MERRLSAILAADVVPEHAFMIEMLAEVAAAASHIDKAVSWTDFGIRSDSANSMLSFKDRPIRRGGRMRGASIDLGSGEQ
ncbi:hypothetical protein [Sinorhizobium meliloti]|uniref:hypothetical protein n=1 Tax=Rhizobium meliloti TaxID=382 RepID=UPI00398C928B